MKYLAILKDSLREARDSWVLLGLFVLSTLMILLVGLLSFEPLSAERTMGLFFSPGPMQSPVMFQAFNNRKPEKVFTGIRIWGAFHLEKVELVRGEPDAPQSDYALTVSAGDMPRFQKGHGMIAVEAKAPPGEEEKKEAPKRPPVDRKKEADDLRWLFEDAEQLEFIKVGVIEPIGKEENGRRLYRVAVQGTPTTYRIWGTETSALFGAVPLRIFFGDAPLSWRIYGLAKSLIGLGSWIAVLLGIVVTAFFIPNMLRKGTVDLLLVKPIQRWLLLCYKYLGGLAFMFLTTAYAIAGMWLVVGLRSGFWANGLFLLIFTLTFFFAILYAFSALVSVITRSIVMTILVTVFAYFGLASLGLANSFADVFDRMVTESEKMQEMNQLDEKAKMPAKKDIPEWVTIASKVVRGIYAASPRTDDLNDINDLIIYSDFMTGGLGAIPKLDSSNRNWSVSLLVSCAWIGIFLGLAVLRFSFKDY